MTMPEQTSQEKRLAKEVGSSSSDNSGEEASKITSARGEDNLGSGDGNPESGKSNPESGNCHSDSGTATWTRVTATQVWRMTGKERSWSRWTSTWYA
jgi:hypothetical protein